MSQYADALEMPARIEKLKIEKFFPDLLAREMLAHIEKLNIEDSSRITDARRLRRLCFNQASLGSPNSGGNKMNRHRFQYFHTETG